MQETTYLLISEVASLLNVESHVLRYWEDELGLNIKRNEFGHRCYTQKDVQFFLQIKELKEEGYPLKVIKAFLMKPSDNLIPMPRRENSPAPQQDEALDAQYEKMYASRRESMSVPAMPLAQRTSMVPMRTSLTQTLSPDEKMERFQTILNRIVSNALQSNNAALGQEVGNHVSERMIKEMDYFMRSQEEVLEAHFQNLGQTIRQQQDLYVKSGRRKAKKEKKNKQALKEVAAAKDATPGNEPIPAVTPSQEKKTAPVNLTSHEKKSGSAKKQMKK